jgi:hypothetical protein
MLFFVPVPEQDVKLTGYGGFRKVLKGDLDTIVGLGRDKLEINIFSSISFSWMIGFVREYIAKHFEVFTSSATDDREVG